MNPTRRRVGLILLGCLLVAVGALGGFFARDLLPQVDQRKPRASQIISGTQSEPQPEVVTKPHQASRPREARAAIEVTIRHDGAAPEEMDETIAQVIGQALAAVEGVESVSTQSRAGLASATLLLKPDRAGDATAQDVRDALALVRAQLPAGADAPILRKLYNHALPVAWVALSGSRPQFELSDIAARVVRPRLLAVKDVGAIDSVGTLRRLVTIAIDPQRLRAFDMDAVAVVQAIEKEISDRPSGLLRFGPTLIQRPAEADAANVEAVMRVVVGQRAGNVVRLQDVATVEEGVQTGKKFARFNRRLAVALGVRVKLGGDPVSVARDVKKELTEIRKELPNGIELTLPVEYVATFEGERSPVDAGLLIELCCPPGGSLEHVDRLLQACETALAGIDAATGALCLPRPETEASLFLADILVPLKPTVAGGPSRSETITQIRHALEQVAGLRFRILDLSGQGLPPRRVYPVEMFVQGPNWGELMGHSQRLAETLQVGKILTDVAANVPPPLPQITYKLDRKAAARLGVSVRQVADTLRLLGGSQHYLDAAEEGRRLDVRLRSDRRDSPDLLQELHVRTNDDRSVPLGSLVVREVIASPPLIQRYNQLFAVEISGNPAAGLTPAQALARCRAIAAKELPEGYRLVVPRE